MKKIFLLLLALVVHCSYAQDGKVMTSYLPQAPFAYRGTNTVKELSDGSLITVSYNGSIPNIVKLTPTGQLDPNFSSTYFQDFQVTGGILAICIQNDGQILLGGTFNTPLGERRMLRFSSTGTIDNTFSDNLPEDSYVHDIEIQPGTNKILVAVEGDPDNPIVSKGLYRLNASGLIDITFNATGTGVGYNGFGWPVVHDIETYANGDIIITGVFNNYNNTSRAAIAKINADGTLNTTTFAGSEEYYNAAIDSNGNIIAVGPVDTIDRYFASGTTDTSFQPNLETPYAYFDVKIQDDGKIVLAMVNHWDETEGRLIRLNTNGSIDTCFDYPVKANQLVSGLLIAYDDNIITWGYFTAYDDITRPGLAKIHGKTILDAVPDTGTATSNGGIAVTNVLANDTINGQQATTSNVTLSTVSSSLYLTLYSNGSVNVAEDTPVGTYILTYKICPQGSSCNCDQTTVTVTIANTIVAHNNPVIFDAYPDWQTSGIIGNDTFNGVSATSQNVSIEFITSLPQGIVYNPVLDAIQKVGDSTPLGHYEITYKICDINDPTNCDTAIIYLAITTYQLIDSSNAANSIVTVTGVQSDEKVIIAGNFSQCSGVNSNKIARLGWNMQRDPSFNTSGPSPVGSTIMDLKVLPTNGIMVVGNFTGFSSGTTSKGIAKLTPSGTLSTFNSGGSGISGGTGGNAIINCVDYKTETSAVNDYVIIGGDFTSYNGTAVKNIAKLRYNGTLDTSFNTGTGFNGAIYDVLIQPNGYIIVAGAFSTYNGVTANKIIRLLPNGSKDPSFNPGGLGVSGAYVEDVLLITGNKIVISGSFTAYNGQAKRNINLLDSNGVSVSTFNPGSGFNGIVRAITYQDAYPEYLQEVNRIFVGGDFTSYNGTTIPTMTALKLDGTIDTTFTPGTGPGPSPSKVYTLSMQRDGLKVILGGDFTTYNNYAASYVTRIFPNGLGNYGSYPSRMPLETTDITGVVKSDVNIYPNPSEGIFNLQMTGYEGQEFEMVIYNPLGQMVHQSKVMAGNNYQLDLTNFQSGNYFVRLQNSNTTINKIITKK